MEKIPHTLLESLAFAGTRQDRHITIYDKRGKNAETRTHAALIESGRLAARRLNTLGIKPGDRVLICLPTSYAWLEAWLGCVLSGALPVAVAPGAGFGPSEMQVEKINLAAETSQASLLIAEPSALDDMKKSAPPREARFFIAPEQLAEINPGTAGKPREDAPESTAFLQLTSGSTGRQRAVMISQRAAAHNPVAIDLAAGAPFGKPGRGVARCVASWLPLYHDMGLVGCVLYSLANGFELSLLRPETFLARPRIWMEIMGKGGPWFTPAPNFAYQICAERVKPEELGEAHFKNWFSAQTGAEMVRPETCAAFAKAFAERGFNPKAFRPCYGMAESTLCATMDLKGAGIRVRPVPASVYNEGSETVALGPAVLDTEIRIAAPGNGDTLGEGSIGEVLIKGPGVFSGYFKDSEASAAALKNGWLHTGDLGFMHAGELYITGRIKELLIIRGHNYMPHEIERHADAATGGGGAERCGAFSVSQSDGEHAVLAIEWNGNDLAQLPALEHEIRSRVGHSLGLPLADVLFTRRGQLPKTTSGKVQRGELRKKYQAGQLERLNKKS